MKKDNLNEIITNLFFDMIKRHDKIVSISGSRIIFDNGLAIWASKKCSEKEIKDIIPLSLEDAVSNRISCIEYWNIVRPDTDKLIFHIDTSYRSYTVPEFTDRHQYAEVLDTLENSIQKFEHKKLSEYSRYFQLEEIFYEHP